jgi:S-DNA-T family DNA segregation ATPase FtsK/SpoIIIE
VTTNADPVSSLEADRELARIQQRLSQLKAPEVLATDIDAGQKRLYALRDEWSAADSARTAASLKARDMSRKARAIIAGVHQDAVSLLEEMAAEYSDALAQQPAPQWSGWLADAWVSFERSPAPAMLDRVRVGSTAEANLLPAETGIGDIPFMIPLLEATGAILIMCDTETASIGRSLVQSILLRAALAMPTETRFTLIDPQGLGAAFPFHARLLRGRRLERNAVDELATVLDGIRRINRDVVGFERSFLDLSAETRAGEAFELIAAVDFPEAYMRDPRVVDQLTTLANSGWRAGRHLILEVHIDRDLPREVTLEQFKDAVVLDCRSLKFSADPLPPADVQRRRLDVAAMVGTQRSVGDWAAVVRPSSLYGETAARWIETPVGERLRFWFGQNSSGQSCAHAMLAGQVGSGKSYLLHVLITGLATRYAPNELRFVLVDLKEGVEFEAYRDLPHADIVCLNTSPAMARNVLADYVEEMDNRWARFRHTNVVDLAAYRAASGEKLPRMLMIIDEFQRLLDADQVGASLLLRVLEQGRAAGTHVLLCSQSADRLPSGAGQHIHLRASLCLAPEHLQTQTFFRTEGKRLISELAPLGEAVINDQSGRDGYNLRGAVARLNIDGAERQLSGIVTELRTEADPAAPMPIVLSGRDGAILADNPVVAEFAAAAADAIVLQGRARRSLRSGGLGIETWSAADKPVPLWLGSKFDVRGHSVALLRRAPSEHLLALGPNGPPRVAMIANALAGLRAMFDPFRLEIFAVDGLAPGMPGAGLIDVALRVLEKAGVTVNRSRPDDVATALANVSTAMRSLGPGGDEKTRLLVLNDPDYLGPLQFASTGFSDPPPGPAADLRELLRGGPQVGCHVIIAASGVSALSSILHATREIRWFNHRVLQQINEDDSRQILQSHAAAEISDQCDKHPMAAMHVDMVQGLRAASLFRSYGVDRDVFAQVDDVHLRGVLETLFGDLQ